ncbi:hypothetical protein FBU59_004628 [Linderina macrospora]|uniref:Uncharacterized protein n=1 Tax=Linderina macrospora TaxID=4868 RepID=A0ACC1J4V6_9FUNG|nr:hypothetical protein FBU59_004628 [Linderina macrospora]
MPPGFIAQFDERYKREFYVNTATGQSTWDDPRPAYYAQQQHQSGSRGAGGPPPPPYYQQGPPPPQQQYYQQGPPPQQQYYQQGPPPQQYYQQPPPQQYYQQPPPQQQYSQPQTVVPEQKQSFFKRNPLVTGLAAGAVGMYAAHEIGEHFEEEREEAYDAGFADGAEW